MVSNMNLATDFWRSERDWYKRNRGTIPPDRVVLWSWLLHGLPRECSVLEVGCGEGQQLEMLNELDFCGPMVGCDINEAAIAKVPDGVVADIVDLPFKDGEFDLVFTSGTLIHVPPESLATALAELRRVAKRWVAGYEYWAEKPTDVEWRGRKGVMWKADYPGMLYEAGLEPVKEVYLHDGGNTDTAYLLAVV